MKAEKVLKRIAKVEALMSKVMERSPRSAPHIHELLQDAKAAVIRAKEAVQGFFENPKNPAKHPPKATPEPSKPKRKLSAAGRSAISAATKKRWAAKRAAAKTGPIVKKATAKKAAAKKAAPVKAAKRPSRRVAKKALAKKASVTAPDKKAGKVVRAKTPAPSR